MNTTTEETQPGQENKNTATQQKGAVRFRLSDAIAAAVIGELVAWLLFLLVRVNAPELPIPAALAEALVSLNTALILAAVLPVLSVGGLYGVYLVAKRVKTLYQAAKFALVGALNTFVDFGVFNGLMLVTDTFDGPWRTVFKALGFITAVVNSYAWNKYWAFRDREGAVTREFVQFFVVSTVGFFINVATFTLVADVVGPQAGIAEVVWANIAVLVATLTALSWNFVGYKLWVFKK